MTTRLHDVIVELVSRLAAALDGAAVVVDGPFFDGKSDYPPDAVYVGWDGDTDGDRAATADWSQEWAGGLGRPVAPKNESFGVLCCVISWVDGTSEDIPDCRANALSVLATVNTTVRADATLGQPQPGQGLISEGQLYQEEGPQGGVQARVPFVIHWTGRI